MRKVTTDPFDIEEIINSPDLEDEPTQRLVKLAEDVDFWASNYLDLPAPTYGGHKVCPFSKPSITDRRIRIYPPIDIEEISGLKAEDPPQDDWVFVCTTPVMPLEDARRWVDHQNENHFGVWMWLVHPDMDDIPGTKFLADRGVMLIKMVRIENAEANALRLAQTPYYRRCPARTMLMQTKRLSAFKDFISAFVSGFRHLDDIAVEDHADGNDH